MEFISSPNLSTTHLSVVFDVFDILVSIINCWREQEQAAVMSGMISPYAPAPVVLSLHLASSRLGVTFLTPLSGSHRSVYMDASLSQLTSGIATTHIHTQAAQLDSAKLCPEQTLLMNCASSHTVPLMVDGVPVYLFKIQTSSFEM